MYSDHAELILGLTEVGYVWKTETQRFLDSSFLPGYVMVRALQDWENVECRVEGKSHSLPSCLATFAAVKAKMSRALFKFCRKEIVYFLCSLFLSCQFDEHCSVCGV